MIRIGRLLLLAAVAARVTAQTPTGVAAVDSAAVARTAWRTANAALQKGDLATARRDADRAASAWPTQEAYVWGRVVLAARALDTAGVIRALETYGATGFGRDVRTDTRFDAFAGAARFAAVAARVSENRAPLARSRVLATMNDSTFWPEGMDADPRSGHYFVASIRHGAIAELESSGRLVRTIVPRHAAKTGAILGVRVDAARGVIWATTDGMPQTIGYAPADSSIAALLRISLSDGVVERRWDLRPSALGHTLGDLAIASNGDVFTTDSSEPVLYRLRAGADTLERYTDPLFRSLQGIAPSPDGRNVYLADWSHGLLRLDLTTRSVRRLADAPNSSSLGCDGIVLYSGAIIAVQNGSVPRRMMRYTLDVAGERITRAEVIDRHTTIADEPTIGAIVGSEFVYVANSQWDKYADDGTRIRGTTLARPILLALPLPAR